MEEDRPAPSDDLGSTKISAWQLLGSMTRISCFLVVFSIVHYGMVPLVTVPMLSSTPNDPALAFPITLDGVRCSAADLQLCVATTNNNDSSCCKSVAKASTPSASVPTIQLFVLSTLLPLVIIGGVSAASKPSCMTSFLRDAEGIILSLALLLATVELAKKAAGRPRPFYLALSAYCDAMDASAAAGSQWQQNAAAERLSMMDDARASFPSGHAGIAFQGMTYLSLRLVKETPRVWAALSGQFAFDTAPSSVVDAVSRGCAGRTAWLLWFLICLVPFSLSCYISGTRLIDFWHNYADVVTGALLGAFVATVTFVFQEAEAIFQKQKSTLTTKVV